MRKSTLATWEVEVCMCVEDHILSICCMWHKFFEHLSCFLCCCRVTTEWVPPALKWLRIVLKRAEAHCYLCGPERTLISVFPLSADTRYAVTLTYKHTHTHTAGWDIHNSTHRKSLNAQNFIIQRRATTHRTHANTQTNTDKYTQNTNTHSLECSGGRSTQTFFSDKSKNTIRWSKNISKIKS